jgi:hypothetical protein
MLVPASDRFFMSFRFKTRIRFKGRQYASAEQMPAKARDAYTQAVGETPILHSGARLAAKLNAKIIVNGVEFSNPGEMSVDERRLYHDALAALLPSNIAVAANEAGAIRRKKMFRALVVVMGIGAVLYLWLHGFFG